MDNMNVRKSLIIPFVKYEEVIINGEKHHEPKDNLTKNDIDYLEIAGYEPVFLSKNEKNEYFMASELPLYFNGGTSIKGFICYLFDDLSEEDKIIFKDKTEEIELLINTKNEEEVKTKEVTKKAKKRFFSRSK